jgi:hypothetical protein
LVKTIWNRNSKILRGKIIEAKNETLKSSFGDLSATNVTDTDNNSLWKVKDMGTLW